MEQNRPLLTEPGVKYFLGQTLKQCHNIRMNYYNLIFNIGLFLGFCIILGTILLYKYKGKMTPIEKQKKDREKQQYILERIKQFQESKKQLHQELITGLPSWESEFDILHNNI